MNTGVSNVLKWLCARNGTEVAKPMVPMMREAANVMGLKVMRTIWADCYAVYACVAQVENVLRHDGVQAYSVLTCVRWVNSMSGKEYGFTERWIKLMLEACVDVWKPIEAL